MRKSILSLAICLLGIGLAWNVVAQTGGTERATRRMESAGVLTDKEAFVLLPPEIISGPNVLQEEVSPAGRYVLLVRQTARITAEMIRAASAGLGPSTAPADGDESAALG